MRTPSKLRVSLLGTAFTALVAVSAMQAQVISIPNATFGSPTTPATGGGGILGGNYNTIDPGGQAWDITGTGIGSILGGIAAPSYSIGGGSATLSGVAAVNLPLLGGVLESSATIYNNDIGADFVAGNLYRFSVDFTGNTLLTASLLNNIGFAVAIRGNGSNLTETPANLLSANLQLFGGGTSGRVTLDYLATGAVAGQDIGLALMTGHNTGLIAVSLLNQITFTGTSLQIVPEPGTSALLIIAGLGMLVLKRRSLRNVQA